ncbi:hypothetical protein [Phaeocystidibacter luteus]|uniref:Uncharacterized protein n=1 Tax=Phaeocystidibacter luteus TaxID=911197 RepID=A0A6N6RDZ9_9FLAO|nr:hypothetical protein [Phaeocystidibacter luteus]KAB2807707.1 hypothetical protein F8C67_11745 [Phaeocystidibacter luteus]
MDILKVATDWAKDELVSTSFFVLVGLAFVLMSIGFWQFGKTDLARAYIIPMLVAGSFLMTVGIGLFYTNKTRIAQFEMAYADSSPSFISAEIERTESTLKEYKTIVFRAIPIIIIASGIVLYFFNAPLIRASMITTIAMLSVILLIDGLAHARIDAYHKHLIQAHSQL